MTRRLLALKTLRELRAGRAQTLALTAVVTLGVSVFIGAIGAYDDLATSEAITYRRLRLADAWYRIEATNSAIAREVSGKPGIAAVEARLVVDGGLQVGGDRVRSRLIGSTVTAAAAVNDVAVIDGRRPSGPGDVLLERTFADRRGITPGDTLTAVVAGQPVQLRVAATVASPEYLQVTPDRYELLPAPSSFAVIFIDLAQLQNLTGNPGRVNDLNVRLDRGASSRVLERLEADLRERGGLIEAVPRADQASYAALAQDLASFRAVAVAMPAIILLAGMAAMAVMLGRVVRAQRPLIGVMKALGYSDGAVLGHYLAYAGVIGLAGAGLGVAGGTVLSGVVTRAYTGEIGVPYSTSTFHPALAILAVAVSLAAVTLAAWRPARRSARIPPALATRVDPAGTDRPGRRTLLESLVPLPLTARLPLRTATRARGRAAATAGGIAAAIVLMLMVLSLRDAVDLFVTRTFDDLERWDLSVTLDEPRDPAALQDITGARGVLAASPFLEAPARLEAAGRREDVLLTALRPNQDLRRLRLDSADVATALSAGQLVLTGGLADKLAVDAGDAVSVTLPSGQTTIVVATPAGPLSLPVAAAPRRATLTVSATSDEPIPARAYIGFDTVAQLTGTQLANGIHLRVEGAAGAIRSALYDLPGVTAVAIRTEQRDDLRTLLSVFNALIAVMLAFAVAMAFAVLFNAMTINVLEREREYATMRAVGARPTAIALLLATEATLLWAIALIPGLLAGTWVAARLGEAIGADLFVLEARATPASYALAGGGVLAIALVSLILPLRRVAHLDLAAATKTLG